MSRRERGLDWQSDEGRLRHHILPAIGDVLLADVRARHRTRDLAPKTMYNVYSIVSALFRDAKLADLIEQSPCVLDERQPGQLTDKNPEWRHKAVFTRDEVETIISPDSVRSSGGVRA